ncbi:MULTISPECIES: patatin-like phospholipase family protein [Leptospira]|uniref:Alpha/beta hydrolase n=1 Tax=Leptospira kirschneri serovar Pomona TaxID=561005 RepID=A0A1T1DJ02_9LEPT|nr:MULTISPECIES: patatin-like phospholipase family protein [Leptospira]EKP06526.1 cyclic nucleotide-binding domain protein [Leptospira kirschneri str. 2008720114]EMJ91354.1 cyclic nucleotide-binding domain protein [Leptospira kirschneri str. JB]EMK04152.1 cyclic nucleotide-binding domain protein [Leptospira kirschneri]EMK13749.1 cyclic nucleotide-binding domain protein [Leptospira kirschneri serovar Bim str. PUO 1247]EMN03247.1 cyclic nucleotide-binding domain protein [Leptospira kirschneri se
MERLLKNMDRLSSKTKHLKRLRYFYSKTSSEFPAWKNTKEEEIIAKHLNLIQWNSNISSLDVAPGSLCFVLSEKLEETLINTKEKDLVLRELFPGDYFLFQPDKILHSGISEILYILPNELNRIVSRLPNWKKWIGDLKQENHLFHVSKLRPSKKELMSFLSSVELLFRLDKSTLSKLESRMEWLVIPGGEVLLKQGDSGDSMYILVSGRLSWTVRSENEEILAEGELGKGDILGEMSLLSGDKRSATVVALRTSQVVRIFREDFRKCFANSPEALFQITGTIAHRLGTERNQVYRKSKSVRTVSVFPLNFQENPDEFYRSLQNGLRNFGKTILVDYNSFKNRERSLKKRDTYRLGDLVNWFYDLEKYYDKLIFKTDMQNPGWRETCFRQSDRILVLIDPILPFPSYSEEINSMLPETIQKELVFLIDSDFMDWKRIESILKKFPSITHSIVRRGMNVDFGRLSRRLTGKSIGVALSGGGAKGFAHLGLLKCFEENEIPVDMISGTSAGAIMGGLFAMGLDSSDILPLIRNFWLDRNLLGDFTFPFVSLVRGKRYSQAIHEFFKDRSIETLPIPFYAIACNLTKAERKVFDRGLLWKAVRSSTSIPGIFPPFAERGELFVDGGLLDNLPGSILKERGAGILISVDLGGGGQIDKDEMYHNLLGPQYLGEAPSFFNLLFHHLKRKTLKTKYTGFAEIMMRSLMLSSKNNQNRTRKDSDLYIELPVGGYSTFDWDQFQKLYEIGYETGRKKIHIWKNEIKKKLIS